MIGRNEMLTVRNDEYDQMMVRHVQTGGSPHAKAGTARIHRNSYGLSLAKRPYLGGHTTCMQDEASREEGRDCGCGVVAAVVVVGFGGERGRRGG